MLKEHKIEQWIVDMVEKDPKNGIIIDFSGPTVGINEKIERKEENE